MGFSLIASAAILGVTLFMAVQIITGDLLPTIESINDSYGDMKDRLANQLQTDISITTVSRVINGPNYNYNITVQNTGSITLNTEDFVILINGTEYQFTCSHAYLHPESTVYFQVIDIAGDEPKRMKVITDNGIEEYYTYTPP